MNDWQQVWKRLSAGQHMVLCDAGPIPEPDPDRLRLSWIDCEAHPEPFGTLDEASRCIERELGGNPWLDAATQRLRSSLRRHLLGEDPRESDMARFEHALRRAAPEAMWPRPVLLLSGIDRADRASIEGLTRSFASPHPPTWPLLIRFDAREPSDAARALLEQLQRVLPADAFWWGADGGPPRSRLAPAQALARVSPETLRVLRAAATVGDRFEIEIVAQLLEQEQLAVLGAVQDAVDAGVALEERGQGIFRFDAPTGAALREATLPALARAWHWRLAELFGGLPAPAKADAETAAAEALARAAAEERAEASRAATARRPAGEIGGVPSTADHYRVDGPPTVRDGKEFLVVPPEASSGPEDSRTPSWWRQLESEVLESPAGAGVPAARPPAAARAGDGHGERRAARHAEAAGLADDAGERYLAIAIAAANAGRHEQALEAAARASSLAERLPEPEQRLLAARALLVIGQCRWQARGGELGSLELALEPLERGRELLVNCHQPEVQAELASMIANVCYDLGTPQALQRALGEITRASRLWLDAGRPLDAARLLNDEAAIWVKLGNGVRANQLLSRSRQIFRKAAALHPAARIELLETEHLLARLMLHATARPGREREALQVGIEHALAAEAGYRAIADHRQLGRVWETLGRLQLRLGRLDEAAERFERAQGVQREIGDAIGAARSAGAMSEVYIAAQDYPRALECLAESVLLNGEKGSSVGLQYNLATLRSLQPHLSDVLAERARLLGERIEQTWSVS